MMSQSCGTGICSQGWQENLIKEGRSTSGEREHSKQNYAIIWFQLDSLQFHGFFFYSAEWCLKFRKPHDPVI